MFSDLHKLWLSQYSDSTVIQLAFKITQINTGDNIPAQCTQFDSTISSQANNSIVSNHCHIFTIITVTFFSSFTI